MTAFRTLPVVYLFPFFVSFSLSYNIILPSAGIPTDIKAYSARRQVTARKGYPLLHQQSPPNPTSPISHLPPRMMMMMMMMMVQPRPFIIMLLLLLLSTTCSSSSSHWITAQRQRSNPHDHPKSSSSSSSSPVQPTGVNFFPFFCSISPKTFLYTI